MSIKPVDFQVLIPKTMEVARANNDEAQRNLAAQQQQATTVQHKVNDTLNQVYSQSKPQHAKITEKQKDKEQEKGKKKKGKPGDKEEKSLNNGIQTSTIDIKI